MFNAEKKRLLWKFRSLLHSNPSALPTEITYSERIPPEHNVIVKPSDKGSHKKYTYLLFCSLLLLGQMLHTKIEIVPHFPFIFFIHSISILFIIQNHILWENKFQKKFIYHTQLIERVLDSITAPALDCSPSESNISAANLDVPTPRQRLTNKKYVLLSFSIVLTE
jgi:hypothetical protein